MSELKPCPFCGGEAELYESEAYNLKTENMEKGIRWFVMCGRCTALTCAALKGKAIEAWNRRVAIEPERKKGQWMVFETENERYDDIKCPFCKKTYTVDAYRIDDIGFIAEDFKFCPNCGADMRGDQDE